MMQPGAVFNGTKIPLHVVPQSRLLAISRRTITRPLQEVQASLLRESREAGNEILGCDILKLGFGRNHAMPAIMHRLYTL